MTTRYASLADECTFSFARSGGPGGQNVNKVETKVTLQFAIPASRLFSEPQKRRLLDSPKLASFRDEEGVLTLTSQRYRSQVRNREDVIEKLEAALIGALRVTPKRIRTKPTKSSVAERIAQKKIRGERKQGRRRGGWD